MKDTNKTHTKHGFTIIEVSLATALMSVLLIAISIITVNVISVYQKGITMKNLNSVGRELIDDIETAINASLPVEPITTDAFKQQYSKTSEVDGTPVAGVFCTGQYSYIWAAPGGQLRLRYRTANHDQQLPNSENPNPIHLLKIKDWRRQVCISYNKSGGSNQTIDIRQQTSGINYDLPEAPQELLSQTDLNFYIYNLSVNTINSENDQNQSHLKTGEVLFSGSFTLGTDRGVSDNATLSGKECSTTDDDDYFDYCAVNKFKFAARTAGKVQ